MCKYCKDLKDLRNRDKQFYESLVKSWQRVFAKQERLLIQALPYLKILNNNLTETNSFSFVLSFLINRIERELRKDCV